MSCQCFPGAIIEGLDDIVQADESTPAVVDLEESLENLRLRFVAPGEPHRPIDGTISEELAYIRDAMLQSVQRVVTLRYVSRRIQVRMAFGMPVKAEDD